MEYIIIQFRKEFLRKIKDVIKKDKGGNYFKINYCKEKNVIFLIKNNLGLEDVKQIILNLEVEDCIQGPEEDRDNYPGQVLIFKPYFENKKIYIKIRYENENKTVCISIHDDERM